jgi:hypothetical protein
MCCTEWVEGVSLEGSRVGGSRLNPAWQKARWSVGYAVVLARNLDTTVDGSDAHLSTRHTQPLSPMAVEHPHCLMSKMKAQWEEFFGVVRRESMWGSAPSLPNRSNVKERCEQKKGAIRTHRPNGLEYR